MGVHHEQHGESTHCVDKFNSFSFHLYIALDVKNFYGCKVSNNGNRSQINFLSDNNI